MAISETRFLTKTTVIKVTTKKPERSADCWSYRVVPKTSWNQNKCYCYLACNFAKSWPILKILSSADRNYYYYYYYYYYYIRLTAFSRTTWVNRNQKGKPFWILLEQQTMGWQRHQLDHIQITCASLQTDNHASTSPLTFYRLNALPAAQPTASKHWRYQTQQSILIKITKDVNTS